MTRTDFVVVGGGVIGMMTARELASGGASVTLIDKSGFASEASWAGGGIVSPLYPWRYSDAITALASWSQGRYVGLCQQLYDETGTDPELRQKGLLMLAVDDQPKALDWANRLGRPLSKVNGDFVYQLESNLRDGIEQALWMPEVASVRNPRLGQALRQSLELNPRIQMRDQCALEGFAVKDGKVQAIETSQGRIECETLVLCGGAWSGELGKLFDFRLPIQPVKGQMLLFKAEPGLLDRVVLDGGRYLIPREGGLILVGSTLEFKGFDKQTTEEAYQSLYQSALKILPALAEFSVEAHWSGLRPGSPSGIPFIGDLPGYDNLFINAGHFRNGLVLAPASCRLAADLLLDRKPDIDPAPYGFDAEREDQLY
ncbi:MAG: glycine oxidase ThiO [Motiliproteus sp.]|nr:glycine oxidase ThiO [Motiliproteus sp.]MCW9052310.1 glycine oxidase ThiO [Motiliproteus sp.]